MRQAVSRHPGILRKITVPICTRFLPRLKENRIHVHQRQSRSGATPRRGPRGGYLRLGPAPGVIPQLFGHVGPTANRSPAAGQGRRLRSGPRDVPGSASRLCSVSGSEGGGAGRLVAADPGQQSRQSGSALLRHEEARRALGAAAGRRAGSIVAGPRPRPGGSVQLSQPPSRSPGAGGPAGRCLGPTTGGLSRSARLTASGGPELSAGGSAHGADSGGRQEAVGAGPGPAAPRAGRWVMKPVENVRPESEQERGARSAERALGEISGAPRSALSALLPPSLSPSGPDDPCVIRALEEYLAAL